MPTRYVTQSTCKQRNSKIFVASDGWSSVAEDIGNQSRVCCVSTIFMELMIISPGLRDNILKVIWTGKDNALLGDMKGL